MRASHRILLEALVFLAMSLAAFGGLAYAWARRHREARKPEFPAWRTIATNIGFFAVATQAVIFVVFLMWRPLGSDPVLFARWATLVFCSFFVAAPCVLAGKGSSRWWLALSSIFLFLMCWLIVLSR
jgi:hypothetical protein